MTIKAMNTNTNTMMDPALALQMFKTVGKVTSPSNSDTTVVTMSVDADAAASLADLTNTPYEYKDGVMRVVGSHALDFIYALDPSSPLLQNWLVYNTRYFHRNLPPVSVFKARPDAVVPSKSRISDVGYDLSVLSLHKQIGTNTYMYDTGISLSMPQGMYAEVVPRSSMAKSGYMLANSVGIIDNTYNGNIYVALTKVDPHAPDVVLPWRCCQLVFRHQVHVDIEEGASSASDVQNLGRGAGGFGSTGA